MPGASNVFAPISDEELTRLALDADPDAPIDDTAISIYELFDSERELLLPAWYMPGAAGTPTHGRRWKRVVVVVVIVAFLVVNAYGLCSTYGTVTIATGTHATGTALAA